MFNSVRGEMPVENGISTTQKKRGGEVNVCFGTSGGKHSKFSDLTEKKRYRLLTTFLLIIVTNFAVPPLPRRQHIGKILQFFRNIPQKIMCLSILWFLKIRDLKIIHFSLRVPKPP